MRISVLFPFLRLTGGSKVLVDLANGLADRGHQVSGVVPVRLKPLPLGLGAVEWLWRAPWLRRKYRWFTPRFQLRVVPSLRPRWVPDADVAIASSWQTAELAASYSSRHGVRAYFIQDVETDQDGSRAAATYSLPLARIATCPWIAGELSSRFGASVDAMVPLGLDLALYDGRPRKQIPARRFGMLYSASERKGFVDGLEAFTRARSTHPDMRLVVLGRVKRPPVLPDFVEGRWNVDPADVPAVYAGTDAWICPSRSEGWGLPPMEAMGMGCAVVTTRVGGTPYFAEDGVTALVCEPGDIVGLQRGSTPRSTGWKSSWSGWRGKGGERSQLPTKEV
ncbi:MAG: glycosyltransferase family 4 protein [Candidatus Wallbacteria bacterium]|nr:glycosyltransferase family 4 protein [Candidatus Wallbacteria bacterium]